MTLHASASALSVLVGRRSLPWRIKKVCQIWPDAVRGKVHTQLKTAWINTFWGFEYGKCTIRKNMLRRKKRSLWPMFSVANVLEGFLDQPLLCVPCIGWRALGFRLGLTGEVWQVATFQAALHYSSELLSQSELQAGLRQRPVV